MRVPVRNGVVIIDDDDFWLIDLFTWYVDNGGYAYTSVLIDGKQMKFAMHRILNNTPKGVDTDHINHNKLDNSKKNLRNCTKQQNFMNRAIRKNSSSQYKGVSWRKRDNQWGAAICFNQKQIYIGQFEFEVTAAQAYNFKALELFGDFAHLNNV